MYINENIEIYVCVYVHLNIITYIHRYIHINGWEVEPLLSKS